MTTNFQQNILSLPFIVIHLPSGTFFFSDFLLPLTMDRISHLCVASGAEDKALAYHQGDQGPIP